MYPKYVLELQPGLAIGLESYKWDCSINVHLKHQFTQTDSIDFFKY